MPQNPKLPNVLGPDAYVKATRSRATNLITRYQDDPEGLAERLGLKLPEKPVLKMLRLGIITPEQAIERFGEIQPGLRDLVLETCMLQVRSAAAVGPRGGGKELALTTPVPTVDGRKTMGTLAVGDILYDRDGQPCRVTRLYPVQSNLDCYRIEFNDGSSVVASATHPWFTQTQLERGANLVHDGRVLRADGWHAQWQGKRESVRTTAEIRATLRIGKRRDTNHSIDNTLPIQFPKVSLPVDPYLLGVWLGDGDSQQGIISVGQDDTDELQIRLESRGHVVERILDNGGNFKLRVAGLTVALRTLGVLRDKHVPFPYLRGNVSQRRWFLAGLMDTDGTIRNYNNNCQFDNMNEGLADAVYELVVSLGWKATRSKKRAMLYGVDHGVCHRVSFRPTSQVFKMRRKRELLHTEVAQKTRHLRRMIVDVRPTLSVPVRCIEVDSPSHTYLVGEQMVPTHNSQGVSFVEFYLWMIKNFDALNLGGSELQAANVYTYLGQYVDAHEEFKQMIKGEMKVSESHNKQNAWIRVLTASQKQTRSPHAGGIRIVNGQKVKRGGLLVIDEEAEAEPEVVKSALPTINTARPSVNIRSSTFHNEAGSFADLIDNHEEMGYKLYRWDVFDVCEGCQCVGDRCQSEELCFREDHYENFINPDTGAEERKLIHKAYCGGRAMYAEGWVPYEEIVTLWMRMKRHHETFEIEQMGSRPGSSGFVIKSRKTFLDSVVPEPGVNFYLPGFPVSVCVDWGTVNAGVCVWQALPQDQHVLLASEQIENAGINQIIAVVTGYANKFAAGFSEMACDVGGGGNYLNPYLRERGFEVRDVKFAEEKESAVAAWNITNESQGGLIIPEENDIFIDQVKRWRRVNGRIQKGNDHLCDASVCYFAKFAEELGVNHLRVPPKAFNTSTGQTHMPLVPGQLQPSGTQGVYRVPVGASFGASGIRRR